jgi:RecA/RadA recombinase
LFGAPKVVLVFGECQVTRLRAICRRKTMKDQGGITNNFASELFGYLSSGKRHKANQARAQRNSEPGAG